MVLPSEPRSWIGKALIVGATIECSYFTPAPSEQEWVLINGTPASCIQLGLYHLFHERPPIDLVVSGPNYGHNATTIYSLSSGTVGGALEAALCKKRAIALSFASKDAQPLDMIEVAARTSVKLIEKLYRDWDSGVELYSINVPMTTHVGNCQIRYSDVLPSRWSSGSLYQEILINGFHNDVPTNGHAGVMVNGKDFEESLDLQNPCEHQPNTNGLTFPRTRSFKWAPQLNIAQCVNGSPPGTDLWAISNGFIRYEKTLFLKMYETSLTYISLKRHPLDRKFWTGAGNFWVLEAFIAGELECLLKYVSHC